MSLLSSLLALLSSPFSLLPFLQDWARRSPRRVRRRQCTSNSSSNRRSSHGPARRCRGKEERRKISMRLESISEFLIGALSFKLFPRLLLCVSCLLHTVDDNMFFSFVRARKVAEEQREGRENATERNRRLQKKRKKPRDRFFDLNLFLQPLQKTNPHHLHDSHQSHNRASSSPGA